MLAVRKALGVLVSLIALAGVLVTVVLATRRIDLRPRTDDGYLQADLVHMAPDVSGRIVELDVRDNQAVHKGDVLFRIDPDLTGCAWIRLARRCRAWRPSSG
jgi:multidrug efflux system membrane fusion protein